MSLEINFRSLYKRIDAVIIWPHGAQHYSEIIDIIKKYNFDPIKVYAISPNNVDKFIDYTYRDDQVPFYHIKSKKKFIKKNVGTAFCIFFKNEQPEIIAIGDNHFRHSECNKIRTAKEEIRNHFNPHINGKRTDDHAIHATDTPQSTMHLLKYFNQNYDELIKKNIFNMPHHAIQKSFFIQEIDLKSLSCNLAYGNPENYLVRTSNIAHSPHFRFLMGEKNKYNDYIDKYRGFSLTDYYSEEKFQTLACALISKASIPPIIIKQHNADNFIIQDGLHRASIWMHLGKSTITSLVL